MPGSFAAHDGVISGFLASLLGPGYASEPTPNRPARLYSGFRSATIVLVIFVIAYWISGEGTLHELRNVRQWGNGAAPNSVLNYLLLVLIFWSSLLTALTFYVDRFRLPALFVLAFILVLIAFLGTSDHRYSTVERKPDDAMPTPQQALKAAPGAVIVVAAAGGGIQSAAWTSRVLCGLRSDPSIRGFDKNVLAISGVSGGSVGTMFYLRCLEGAEGDQTPATWAQNSSLEAVAWGLTHPDLRRIFIPGPSTQWSLADRGWALERSLLKSARFEHTERRLAAKHENPAWPIVLLNSTDARTGDPVVFTNSQFPASNAQKTGPNHYLRNFHLSDPGRDVLVETAARMSAAYPYVSPEARPNDASDGVHLGDGGYFDNSGVFALGEWLKTAVSEGDTRRILFLQLDAFPDSASTDQETAKKWYYQLTSPINTMLEVRSEGQVVRDKSAGEDLQKILNGEGNETTWLLVRYIPPPAGAALECPSNPPLSWHLTLMEQRCIDEAWSGVQKTIGPEISRFLAGNGEVSRLTTCEDKDSPAIGVYERICPAAHVPAPAQRSTVRQ
jgi:hypothetical protein